MYVCMRALQGTIEHPQMTASDYLALLSAILFYRTDYDWISYKGALKTMLQFFGIISVI